MTVNTLYIIIIVLTMTLIVGYAAIAQNLCISIVTVV